MITCSQPFELLFGDSNQADLIIGLLLIALALVLMLGLDRLKRLNLLWTLVIGTAAIETHSIAKLIQSGYLPEQTIEHSLQIFLPLVVAFGLSQLISKKRFILLLKILVALTFVGHAFFALGVNKIPGGFLTMTTNSLGLTEEASRQFLFVIGILDIIFALGIFVPVFSRIAYVYLIVWGIVTACARLYAFIGVESIEIILLERLPNVLYRLPHGLIPLFLALNHRSKSMVQAQANS